MTLIFGKISAGRPYKLCPYKNKKVYRKKNSIRKTMRLILGHIGTYWDNSEDFLTSLGHSDCFPIFSQPFSPIIGSLKKTRSGRTNRPTDRRTDGPLLSNISKRSFAWRLMIDDNSIIFPSMNDQGAKTDTNSLAESVPSKYLGRSSGLNQLLQWWWSSCSFSSGQKPD